MKQKLLCFIVICFSIFSFVSVKAENITKTSTINLNGKKINTKVIDDKESTYLDIENGTITISNTEAIQGVYISYYKYDDFSATLTANGKSIRVGEDRFLHQYIDVKKLLGVVYELELKYDGNVSIGDIYVIGEGDIPEFVEIWEKPCEKADILLFSTHSDDEHLFFLGLIPTYIARGANFQVVYVAHHNDNLMRLHEQLHGLYTVGLRNYPIIGIIPDEWSTTLEEATSNIKKVGISTDDIINFQVEMIRRFKPQVVVGHDEAGEYSHGQHILNTNLLKKAIINANEVNYDQSSSVLYGTWQISKLYLHLYGENQIVMDYDTPIDYYGGMTAYQVSKEGYKKHNSQQWTWFTKWINGKENEIKKASEIETYSPCNYGLYYTNVGPDEAKNDMMEHLIYYNMQVEDPSVTPDDPDIEIKPSKLPKERTGILIIIALIIVFAGIGFLFYQLYKESKK